MNQTKAELRKALLQARLSMSPEDRAAKSVSIRAKLRESHDWNHIKTVHCFEPINRLAEVDVTGSFDGFPVEIYTSRKVGDDWQIVSLTGSGSVPKQFDAIIVPMLGFDDSLQRIGYGGGYYDKLLSTQTQALKIGVCFARGKIDHVPIEPHDIPLDQIITEA